MSGLVTSFVPEKVLRIAFAAWSRWEYDLHASTAKDAEAVDRRRMPAFRTLWKVGRASDLEREERKS